MINAKGIFAIRKNNTDGSFESYIQIILNDMCAKKYLDKLERPVMIGLDYEEASDKYSIYDVYTKDRLGFRKLAIADILTEVAKDPKIESRYIDFFFDIYLELHDFENEQVFYQGMLKNELDMIVDNLQMTINVMRKTIKNIEFRDPVEVLDFLTTMDIKKLYDANAITTGSISASISEQVLLSIFLYEELFHSAKYEV